MSLVKVSHDLRGRFGPAREQGGRQTCLAFATSDAHAAAIGEPWAELCCEFLFYHAKQRDGTSAHLGTTFPAIRAALEYDGQPVETEWPYLAALPADMKKWKPPKIKTLFHRESKPNGTGFDEVWKAVEADSPTVVGMTLTDTFRQPTKAGVIDADEPPDPVERHAVLAVATGKLGKKKLVLVRNSWGLTWGLSGYAWVSERYMTPRILVAMTLHQEASCTRESRHSQAVRAWVAACNEIMKTGDEGYNIVIDVADPVTLDDKDHEAVTLVDKFLKLHDKYRIITVANTIFPQSLLDAHGPTEFYKIYHRDFDALSADSRRWGRYFDRMTRHQTKDGTEYNPLQEMIEKMKPKDAGQYKAAYELAVYDPIIDSRMFRGGQCLSFLSFKIHPKNGLLLTAMYRNHTYITRCLGNLIGLGRLMRFIAKQAGLKVGSLTVISTHAELDTEGWGIKASRELVTQAEGILRR